MNSVIMHNGPVYLQVKLKVDNLKVGRSIMHNNCVDLESWDALCPFGLVQFSNQLRYLVSLLLAAYMQCSVKGYEITGVRMAL